MRKNLRILLLGFGDGGGGGGVELDDVGGAVWTLFGGGGVRGTFWGGIVEEEGVDGVGESVFELGDVATAP